MITISLSPNEQRVLSIPDAIRLRDQLIADLKPVEKFSQEILDQLKAIFESWGLPVEDIVEELFDPSDTGCQQEFSGEYILSKKSNLLDYNQHWWWLEPPEFYRHYQATAYIRIKDGEIFTGINEQDWMPPGYVRE